jgi:hypothetical protein
MPRGELHTHLNYEILQQSNLKISWNRKKIKTFIFFFCSQLLLRQWDGIKSHFLTLGKTKKTSQNNEYNIVEMKVKKWLKLVFFFAQANSPKLILALAKCKFLLCDQKKQKLWKIQSNIDFFKTIFIAQKQLARPREERIQIMKYYSNPIEEFHQIRVFN